MLLLDRIDRITRIFVPFHLLAGRERLKPNRPAGKSIISAGTN
jgi:hypothetical protein